MNSGFGKLELDFQGRSCRFCLARRGRPAAFENSTCRAHDLLENEHLDSDHSGRLLPRQLRLRLGVWVGAKRRVRRGPSLGDSTSAGAENSQATLHVLQSERPTMTALLQQELGITLAFAVLTPSESNVVRSKIKSN